MYILHPVNICLFFTFEVITILGIVTAIFLFSQPCLSFYNLIHVLVIPIEEFTIPISSFQNPIQVLVTRIQGFPTLPWCLEQDISKFSQPYQVFVTISSNVFTILSKFQ